MRSGPTLAQLAGPLTWGARVESWWGGSLQAEAPVLAGSLSSSTDQAVLDQLQVTLEPRWVPTSASSPFANFGQQARLLLDVGPRTMDMGFFPIQSWAEQDDGSVQVTAAGLLQLLADDPMVWASSPPAGARLSTEAQRLCGDMLRVRLDPGVEDLPVSHSLSWGTSRIDALQDLGAAMGVLILPEPDGLVHIRPLKSRDPVAHFTGADLFLAGVRAGTSRASNVVTRTATVNSMVGGKSVERKISATARTSAPPFDPSHYGVVRTVTDTSSVSDQSILAALAAQDLRAQLDQAQTRSFTIVPDPRLELGDVITVTTNSGVVGGRVAAIELPLTAASSMRVDVGVFDQ